MRRRRKHFRPVGSQRVRRAKRRRLMATKIGPWLRVVGAILLVAGILVTLYIFAVPPIMEMAGIEWPPQTHAPPTPTPAPTPTPHPITRLDPLQYQRGLDLSVKELRFASDPTRYGDTIYFSAGMDAQNGPENNGLYECDMDSGAITKITNAVISNRDIFRVKVDEDWIVYLDHKRTGGGMIRAIHKESGDTFVVKEYYVGMPDIRLSDGLLAWTERTGTHMDKVFVYDLATRENLTAATLERTIFGQSSCDISSTKLVWARKDSSASDGQDGILHGSIYSLDLRSGEDKQVEEFPTGMYVHNPRTNGEVVVWSDQNYRPDAKLFISIRGGEPEQIAEGVTDYDVGTDFVAYCANQVMYVYFYGSRGFEKQISLQGEKCIFGGFGQDTVFYYVTGGISSNDIIKYVPVNDIDMSKAPIIPTLAPESVPPGAIIATPTPQSDTATTTPAPLPSDNAPAIDQR